MAGSSLSPAKALLLAVQLATKANISTLRTLVSKYSKTLRGDLVLRVLLTYLPESLEPSEYVLFIQDLVAGNIAEDTNSPVDTSALEELSEPAASKRVRKLHLLPLPWPNASEDAPADHLVQFLIHRSIRIDDNTGLITLLPELLIPFLHHSAYLRTWAISTILPLLRLNYEYHPQDGANISIPTFEGFDDQAAIAMLLSRTGGSKRDVSTVGRDLRGLVGPWIYGNTRLKRKRLGKSSSFDANSVAPLDEHLTLSVNEKCASWEEIFNWLIAQVTTASWKTAVEAFEQWDGPGDVDLGGYDDGTEWLDEEDQQHLERRYARAALACACLISDDSMDGLIGIRRLLGRLHTLLDLDPLPTLEVAAALLSPVSGVESLMSPKNSAFLRERLLEESNIVTNPTEPSIRLLHALLVSAFLVRRAGVPLLVRRVGQLVLLQDEPEQKYEVERVVRAAITKGAQSTDNRYWVRTRNELLWLRNWGAEEPTDGADVGRGVFGRIPKEFIEVALLRGLLSNNRISLARQIYETAPIRPISQDIILKTVLSEAMNAYDNATNPNRTRGGLKRCNDMLRAFPDTLEESLEKEQLEHLLTATHLIGEYRLVFKQGELFRPVMLRVHGDPISIIGKVLDQNQRSYTQINDFIRIGKELVLAGLTFRNINGHSRMSKRSEVQVQVVIAEKRVVSMCIDAALAEDDFETAYSYIMTRLVNIAGPAQERTPDHDRSGGLFAELPPKMLDDWSWRAALQAGKYRRTVQTIKPTHLGNASGNPDIRHLEQRMECLSHAVRLAPKSTLQEILNVFRRCEEELESLSKQEDEQEAAWDAQGDDQVMPGGFGATAKTTVKSTSRAEEAPMSLFDLSRGALTRAQSGLGSLSRVSAPESGTGTRRERRRDQIRNAAVGTVAAGVGWLIGAPGVAREEQEDR